MAYAITRTIGDTGFDEVVERTPAALSEEGFGVLTEIDARATMKKKARRGYGAVSDTRRLQSKDGTQGDRH